MYEDYSGWLTHGSVREKIDYRKELPGVAQAQFDEGVQTGWV